MLKESACNAGNLGLIPGSGRSPGEGNDYPFQYSCLENFMDRGAWWAIVHGVCRVRHDLVTEPQQQSYRYIDHLLNGWLNAGITTGKQGIWVLNKKV